METFNEIYLHLYLLSLLGILLSYPVFKLIINLGMGYPESTINPAYKEVKNHEQMANNKH